jgi:hypothetical protein
MHCALPPATLLKTLMDSPGRMAPKICDETALRPA